MNNVLATSSKPVLQAPKWIKFMESLALKIVTPFRQTATVLSCLEPFWALIAETDLRVQIF